MLQPQLMSSFMRVCSVEEFKKEIQEKTTSTHLLVNNLDENVTYFFSVRAETLAGYGDEIIGNVTVGPNPGCPEAPSKPYLVPGQISVTLEWEDGQAGASSINGHIIQAKRIARAKVSFIFLLFHPMDNI
uniref:Fibronectin type-III domain-containing protein n=1 Tax=Parascaris equorum TaxID=6256 RepID=A0A914R669_PAREQ